ncbi:hypothetical protein GL218_09108 [Daldinia childiae]|uniref:uncharacterized protein n=1 Tax=Daldinia childiae TaxID=326645 RepID=UPI0014456869|nr:uncharacterized protein GL218_09108 [Daldinia childiae]KAF3066421.1 hypothetical protein GL218_09108 [Daldinia childiae]
MTSLPENQQRNYAIFRDYLSTALIEKISRPEPKPKRRSKSKKATSSSSSPKSTQDTSSDADLNNADDLADFADYIATETFRALPEQLKTVDYHEYTQDATLQARFAQRLPLTGASTPTILPTLDPTVADSLSAYSITSESTQGADEFLAPILTAFLTALGTAPRAPRATLPDADGCELCGRDWVPLSYHHLIPRFVHGKAVKRKWHRAADLENVAWLCGACHRFVHRFAGHEELARRYYTVELLMGEEAVRRWVEWVGRLRWKGR